MCRLSEKASRAFCQESVPLAQGCQSRCLLLEEDPEQVADLLIGRRLNEAGTGLAKRFSLRRSLARAFPDMI